MKASMYWLPVPQNIALFPAEEQVAWISVLDALRRGEPMGRNELRRRTGWGGSRADRFLADVEDWAAGQSRAASGPLPGQSRAASGPLPGRSAKEKAGQSSETGPLPGQSRAASGPVAGRSRADGGPVVPENPPPSERIAPPKKEQKEENQNSLSPTPLSEGGERERPASPLVQKLPARLVAALAAGGIVDEATLRGRTDAEIRYLPGVGEAGLATVRAAFPAAGVRDRSIWKKFIEGKQKKSTEVADA